MELEQRGSTQSLELDILQLTQRWESQRTIRNGDTPGQALRKGAGAGAGGAACTLGLRLAFPVLPQPLQVNHVAMTHLPAVPRPALAPIPANVAVAAAAPGAINPFSFTAQRQKAAASRCHQQQQQPGVRFALEDPAAADAENAGAAAGSAAATPAIMPPASHSKAAVAASAGGASAGSPSPYVLFRGRLSFAAEADSGAPGRARAPNLQWCGPWIRPCMLAAPRTCSQQPPPTLACVPVQPASLIVPSQRTSPRALGSSASCSSVLEVRWHTEKR